MKGELHPIILGTTFEAVSCIRMTASNDVFSGMAASRGEGGQEMC